MNVRFHTTHSGEEIAYVGPPLEDGPLPALFYFSLSAEESLTLDPFNQPAVYLANAPLRIFSFTLPGHGEGFDKHKAIAYWASEMEKGNPLLTDFLDKAEAIIQELVDTGIVDQERVAAAGLSRGGFIATHLAARMSLITTVCGFAPLTNLSIAPDFASIAIHPEVQELSLIHFVNQLTHVSLRYYIGNRDVLVSTDQCYTFISALTEACWERRIRSPHVELILSPSIGHKGHGTEQKTFHAGADWLKERLLS